MELIMKLSDLEICKRIAKIEGIDLRGWHISTIENSRFYVFAGNGATRNINYLTDDALCFKLMVKYKIEVEFADDGYTRAWQYHHIDGQDTMSKSPNKAICLAIIEANKEIT